MSAILDRYIAAFPRSAELSRRAKAIFPNGVTHDLRNMTPFAITIDRAQGARKWDVDGHTLVDYWAGHGSMLLGHSHPDVVAAVQSQMPRMTHAGGSNELELEWAELVRELIPSAEMVRFTGSGTEATLMAIRLCRMFTGRGKFLKFAGHFHGWHDGVTIGSDPPYERLEVPGVPDDIAISTVVAPPNKLDVLETMLKNDPQIGAIILEPTGGHWGTVPMRGEFLHALRELTLKYGQMLIFDEVITGFRVSPGGAQAHYGVKPDLTTLAKILAGGLPGGAVVGRADLLNQITIRPGQPKMRHPGTYNGNPLSAAAGIATLKHVRKGEACRLANEAARALRNELNLMFARERWPWIAYGDFSIIRILNDYHGSPPAQELIDFNNGFIPHRGDLNKLDGPRDMNLVHSLRRALLLHGVDMPGMGGWLTAEHGEDEIVATVDAMNAALRDLEAEGLVKRG